MPAALWSGCISVDQLRTFPESGRAVPERLQVREPVRAPYRIVYRLEGEVVVVLVIESLCTSMPR